MRFVFINHCHPDTKHICATRMREFSYAITKLGHEVILLTEVFPGKAAEISPEETRKKIKSHNFKSPLYLSIQPKGHPLIKRLRKKQLPWGIRQVVVICYFLYYKGVFTDWRKGSQIYLHPIADTFKPDLIWATFLNTDAWNIAKDLSKIAKISWVGDIKDPWGIYIPRPLRTFLAKHFDTCLALSTFSKFNSNDVTKWFKAPTTTIYSGYSECNSKPVNIANLHKINISLTGGIYNYNALKELIRGVKIWFDRLTEIEKSKVQLTYAGHDAEAVKKVMHQFNNFCHINLIGFIPLEKLKEIHESSIANLYIKIYTTFHHKTIELLSAGRPVICYPSEIEEAINIANRSNVDLHSCNKAEDVAQALSKSLNTSSINVSNNEFLQKLTWHNQSIKLEALFKKILDLEKIHKNRRIDI